MPLQPVRHAAAALLLVACRASEPCLRALLPAVAAAHERGKGEAVAAGWGVDPSEGLRVGHAGLVNLGATCYMNALLQQLFFVPAFRDGLLAANPPPKQVRRPRDLHLQPHHSHCLSLVPPFRERLFAANPPTKQSPPSRAQATPILHELQSAFAHLRDGLTPSHDPRRLVEVFYYSGW